MKKIHHHNWLFYADPLWRWMCPTLNYMRISHIFLVLPIPQVPSEIHSKNPRISGFQEVKHLPFKVVFDLQPHRFVADHFYHTGTRRKQRNTQNNWPVTNFLTHEDLSSSWWRHGEDYFYLWMGLMFQQLLQCLQVSSKTSCWNWFQTPDSASNLKLDIVFGYSMSVSYFFFSKSKTMVNKSKPFCCSSANKEVNLQEENETVYCFFAFL